ncbi:MAG TPA: sulfatase-like hydrolase/transferase, partial [Actinomycetota bacterium]|nr:sulfatase-like hydrolase/transferase [Actinomycetota bacterium]
MRPRRSVRRARTAAIGLLLAASSAVGAVTAAPPAAADPPSRPNIVVVNTDDQRFDSLYACLPDIGLPIPDRRTPPTAGSTTPPASDCPMPNVKADLMAHGVTFAESFVTTSLCCPSRASLFLGEFAHRTGVLTNEKPNGGFSAFRDLQDS